MIVSKTYNTVPGGYEIYSTLLIGRIVLSVDRLGAGQTEVSTFSPGLPEYRKVKARIIFHAGVPFEVGEKINVLYED